MNTMRKRKGDVIELHPRLIKRFAEATMRVARLFGAEGIEVYAGAFTEKQQRLIAEYIRNHRKRTKETFPV